MDRPIRGAFALAILLGAVTVLCPLLFPTPLARELELAGWAVARHDYGAAWLAANRALVLEPESPRALLLAGVAAAGRFEHFQAIELLERVPPGSRQETQALFELAERHLYLARVERAELYYRRVLERERGHLQANRRLGFLLQAEGRSWESQPYLAELIRRGDFGTSELLALGSPERFFKSDSRLEQTHAANPASDILIRLGEVRRGLLNGRDAQVRPQLEELVKLYPGVAEARARLGRFLADSGDRREFVEWDSAVTAAHEHHPEIWYVRGLFARREDKLPEAVRCFIETLLRAPSHLGAHQQAGQCLLALGRPELARSFSDRVPLLARLDVEINRLGREETPEIAERVIRLLQELGRHWEAAGWAAVAGRFRDPAPWSAAIVRVELPFLSERGELTAVDSQPARQVDPREFPLPDWSGQGRMPGRNPGPGKPAPGRPGSPGHSERFSRWHFTDEAASTGINFTCYDGTTWPTRMRHVIETVGGGAGVIDFDCDGWPDLYFTQGNAWRRPVSESTTLDRLYRNSGSGRFVDVTEQSGILEAAFSHGIAVGDFDNDGWPDLYVANLGPNSFYHNNGDGTFTEISTQTGTAGEEWSTSCALVDLTGDGLADLFVVNYLDRDYVVEHRCSYKEFEVGCTPDALPPARNRFHVNLGDGQFADASLESGVLAHAGNGLGIVVADFAGEGRLSVFVGNDTTPNFLFRNIQSSSQAVPRLEEQGIRAGVAFNGSGNAMASMGIAAGDVNGDGRLDLFVTTYLHDADTLFTQLADGAFVDNTRPAGLYQPTLATLGFGAQFLDVDNDGWEDIVTTNGHVIPPLPDGPDDESDTMPSQLFANLGKGQFAEIESTTSGEFFERKGLGRGLCRLDWNRDGRQDFCVSYIHSPVAIVTNQTPADHHWLSVHVIGTNGARDAFGTIVNARLGPRELTRQLTAGSGYLATNERRLWFGLGTAHAVEELVVHWPGGAKERFVNLAVDQELLIIEGRTAPIALPR